MPSKRSRRQRGDGGLYQRADGLWVGSVDLGYGEDGKRKRKTVSSKNQAGALRKLRELRRTVADHGAVPGAHTTVEKWLTRWLDDIAAPRTKPRTLAGYRTTVNQHIVPVLGRRRLDQLAPQHVREMQLALRKPAEHRRALAESSILKAHRVLAKALSDAQREGLVVRNVATLVDAPRKGTSTRGALSAEQALALLRSVAADPLGSRWAAALLTGARQGELLGVERDRVGDGVLDLSWQLQRVGFRHGCGPRPADKDAAWPCGRIRAGSCPSRQLDVPPAFEHRVLDGGLVLTRPKSNAGWRVIPLVEPLASILDRHIAATGGGPHNLVWTRPDGRPVDPREDYDAWQAALTAAGLPATPLHSARHTTATLLLEAGIDAHVIKTILGHSDVVTSRGYQHVSTALARQALAALGASLQG